MRAFIVLSLIALACADVSHLSGYNYQTGVSGCGGGSGGNGGGCGAVGSGLFGSDIGGVSSASDVAPSFAGNQGSGIGGGDGGYDKEFYTFNADNGDFDEPQASNEIANSLKKNLQVVFIKGPESHALENAVVDLAKHASEQRTAIYVLNKQPDIGHLVNDINQINNQNRQKPEVHFVKYRTPEDAHNAQTQIQNQYASLPGHSQSHDGGFAPVIDFASKGSSSNVHSSYSSGPSNGGYTHSRPGNTYVSPTNTYVPPAPVPSNHYIPPASPSVSYIPPSSFRRFRL